MVVITEAEEARLLRREDWECHSKMSSNCRGRLVGMKRKVKPRSTGQQGACSFKLSVLLEMIKYLFRFLHFKGQNSEQGEVGGVCEED